MVNIIYKCKKFNLEKVKLWYKRYFTISLKRIGETRCFKKYKPLPNDINFAVVFEKEVVDTAMNIIFNIDQLNICAYSSNINKIFDFNHGSNLIGMNLKDLQFKIPIKILYLVEKIKFGTKCASCIVDVNHKFYVCHAFQTSSPVDNNIRTISILLLRQN